MKVRDYRFSAILPSPLAFHLVKQSKGMLPLPGFLAGTARGGMSGLKSDRLQVKLNLSGASHFHCPPDARIVDDTFLLCITLSRK